MSDLNPHFDLKTIKVGDRVTVRSERYGVTSIVRLDTVKSLCKRWATMANGDRYSYNGNEFRALGNPRISGYVWAVPMQDGDLEVIIKQERQEASKRWKEDKEDMRRSELEKRFHNAIDAEPNPSSLFKAMAHFVSTDEYDYELLEKIEVESSRWGRE